MTVLRAVCVDTAGRRLPAVCADYIIIIVESPNTKREP